MREPVGLLDALEPPSGWVFSSGVLVTHDLSTTVLADLVLPAVTGVGALEVRRRRELARAEMGRVGARMTVLACRGRIAFGAATPGVTVVPVGGRRLHAKFGVIQYRPEEPEHSSKRRTRAVITSANLTSGGLLRHREVVAWEQSGDKAGAAVAADLLRLLRQLADQLPPLDRKITLAAVAALLGGLAKSVQPTGRVHSSGMGAKGEPCLRQAKASGPVDRLVIVTPPFASDHDAHAVAALGPLLHDRPVVDLYTALPPGTPTTPAGLPRLTFSSTILSDLRHSAAELHVYGVPELVNDGDGPYVRRLHAKLIAAVTGSSARIWVGSANLTARGLGGRNREVMLQWTCSTASLNRFLSALEAVPVDEQAAPLPPLVEFTDDPPAGFDLHAEFSIAPGQSSTAKIWDGDLYLVGRVPAGASLEYEGRPLEDTHVQPLRLLEGQCRLEVVEKTGRQWIPIEVRMGDGSLWASLPDDRPPPRQPRIDEFLADLRTAVAVAAKNKPGTVHNGAAADTAFRLPVDQRLVMVARARQLLHLFPSDSLVDRVYEYLGAGSSSPLDVARQRRVAGVLAAHAAGHLAPPDDDLLLAGLAGVLLAVDTGDATG